MRLSLILYSSLRLHSEFYGNCGSNVCSHCSNNRKEKEGRKKKRWQLVLNLCCSFLVFVVVVDDDRFHIALFSALEQTHCARM